MEEPENKSADDIAHPQDVNMCSANDPTGEAPNTVDVDAAAGGGGASTSSLPFLGPMLDLDRTHRVAELVSSWDQFASHFGGKLHVSVVNSLSFSFVVSYSSCFRLLFFFFVGVLSALGFAVWS